MAPRVRRIVVGVVLAIAAGIAGGWWWRTLAGAAASPLVAARSSDVADPPPNLLPLPPAGSASVGAGESPASVHPGASASMASADMASCGAAERPTFADPDVRDGVFVRDQLTGAGAHYLQARADIDAYLRASSDPFDQATADWLNVGDMRTPQGRLDALVQRATATREPHVYGLAYRACLTAQPTAPSCAALTPRTWAALDPGNGIPWAYELVRASALHDEPGTRDALQAMAQAARFDDNDYGVSGAIAGYPARTNTELAALYDFVDWDALNYTGFDARPDKALREACAHRIAADPDRQRECQAITDVMFEHTDSWGMRVGAARLQIDQTGDETRLKRTKDEISKAVVAWSGSLSQPACSQVRTFLARIRWRGLHGSLREVTEAASAVPASAARQGRP